jgi:hypothetical protein
MGDGSGDMATCALRRHRSASATDTLPDGSFGKAHAHGCIDRVFEPPSRDDILRLRAWLRTADRPMLTMPGVEA